MRKWPYPDKPVKNKDELEQHLSEIIFNALEHLSIAGYDWDIVFPGENRHNASENAGASIVVKYPYKDFTISIQQDTLDKAFESSVNNNFWLSLERGMYHELIHVVLWRLMELGKSRCITYEDIQNENESTTDHITNAFYEMLRQWRKCFTNGKALARKMGKTHKDRKRTRYSSGMKPTKKTMTQKPKLGSGKRFVNLTKKLAKKGATNPKALAAVIGRKKFGNKKMAKMSAKGKKK